MKERLEYCGYTFIKTIKGTVRIESGGWPVTETLPENIKLFAPSDMPGKVLLAIYEDKNKGIATLLDDREPCPFRVSKMPDNPYVAFGDGYARVFNQKFLIRPLFDQNGRLNRPNVIPVTGLKNFEVCDITSYGELIAFTGAEILEKSEHVHASRGGYCLCVEGPNDKLRVVVISGNTPKLHDRVIVVERVWDKIVINRATYEIIPELDKIKTMDIDQNKNRGYDRFILENGLAYIVYKNDRGMVVCDRDKKYEKARKCRRLLTLLAVVGAIGATLGAAVSCASKKTGIPLDHSGGIVSPEKSR
ncbi:MAG: hypothetical protein LBU87_05830 [Lactobacillales bacterium]|nr:hypothetical protein [Lactobacillales bacterium]